MAQGVLLSPLRRAALARPLRSWMCACNIYPSQDMVTVAPRSVSVFMSFSASSFGTFSLRVCGTDSTNFFAWTLAQARRGGWR